MTLQESKEELCRRLNITYDEIRAGTNDLFKWADLDSWINLAIHRAWDYFDFAFTEKTYTTTTTASGEYYDYPNDFVSDSIKMLMVADEDGYMAYYEPINFEDFRKFRAEDTENTDETKLWSSHGRYYFINPVAFDNAASRTIEIIGKMRCDNLSDSTGLLPFSPDTDNEENSGNEAVVKLAYSIALSSDKMRKKTEAQIEEREAYIILEMISGREKKMQANYHHKDRPQWNVGQMF